MRQENPLVQEQSFLKEIYPKINTHLLHEIMSVNINYIT